MITTSGGFYYKHAVAGSRQSIRYQSGPRKVWDQAAITRRCWERRGWGCEVGWQSGEHFDPYLEVDDNPIINVAWTQKIEDVLQKKMTINARRQSFRKLEQVIHDTVYTFDEVFNYILNQINLIVCR